MGLFTREFQYLVVGTYPESYLSWLLRTPTCELSDNAQWWQLITAQASMEFLQAQGAG